MKPNIKLHHHYEFTSVQRTYDIVDQFCTARVTIYAMVDRLNAVTINDSEVSFLINNKKVKYNGFRDLYTSLYSAYDFGIWCDECIKAGENEVRRKYSKHNTTVKGQNII
jgi:hypothetical protein